MTFIDFISFKFDNYLIKSEHLKINTHLNLLLLIRVLNLELDMKILYRIYNSSLTRASRKYRNKISLRNADRFCRINKSGENQIILFRVDDER